MVKNFFCLATLIFCSLTLFASTKVGIKGRNLYVNGEPFTIRGVCYSPTPIGKNVAAGYTWWSDRNYLSDILKIKQLCANVIRTYSAPLSYDANFAEFLNECYKNGIYVIIGYWVNHGQDFSNATVRNKEKTNFIKIVETWKNYPAVIVWCFGNEVVPGGSGTDAQKWSSWYSLVQEVATEAKDRDYNHIVMSATKMDYFYNTIGRIDFKSDDVTLSSLDCWGINAYLGYDFKTLFNDYASKSSKPLVITEFGCDSWDGRNGKEDEFMQAKYIVSQWRDIERNLTLNGGVASGGCVFEWTDEWWKSSSNTLGNSGQDTSTDWQNSDYDDPNMNEEWFGIMKISSNIYNSYITSPKKAYNELQKVWNKFVIVEKDNKVYVYPNPAINCEYITFSLLPYDTEKIYIYNIAGELVKTIYVYDVFNTKWFLDNNFGEKVSSGIYFFTIKHNGGIIRNKIAVVK